MTLEQRDLREPQPGPVSCSKIVSFGKIRLFNSSRLTGTLGFSTQQTRARERGLSAQDLQTQREIKKHVGISRSPHHVLHTLRSPRSTYAGCLTHPQILDVSIGAPGGECASSAISNVTNIHHMQFVFSAFFFFSFFAFRGKDRVSWQFLSRSWIQGER